MKIYDLLNMEAEGYENRHFNVFFKNEQFKTRIIVLDAGGSIPECHMETYVMFYVVKGEVMLRKNDESSVLSKIRSTLTNLPYCHWNPRM